MDDEAAKKKEEEEKLEDEFFDAEDEFFKEYRAKLMNQMQQRLLNAYNFTRIKKKLEFNIFAILVLVSVNQSI